MKFSHMADCHIGGWRDQRLRELSSTAFSRAVDISISEKVDFVLISGDLFHTAMPAIDSMKSAVRKLRQLKDNGISVYVVPGSHDFSPSGKTMIDVFAEAGLLHNTFRAEVHDKKLRLQFTADKKTGAKITGIIGRRGMLDREYYESLDRSQLALEDGFRIFMFHTAISELKPKDMENMDSMPESMLPEGFSYYAGGHVHSRIEKPGPGNNPVVYPGPLFPNTFAELERLGHGGFFIYDNGALTYRDIEIKKTILLNFDCTGLGPEQVSRYLDEEAAAQEVRDKIVMIRLFGKLGSGKPSEISLKQLTARLYERAAFFVMRNTSKLEYPETEGSLPEKGTLDEIEGMLLREAAGALKLEGRSPEDTLEIARNMMSAMGSEKGEGEKKYDYEQRIVNEAMRILRLG